MDALITHVKNGEELSPREIEVAANLLLDTSVPDEKKERLLLALSKKGETPAEIAGFVEAFLEHAVDPMIDNLDLPGPTLDVCGTGGDKLNLFNVSTTSMFVAAGAGAIVVKHGNRGITSKSGGADVLEALGIRIDLPPEGFRQCLEKAGVGFLFAPNYHPAFKAVVGVRKSLAAQGHRSIFNLIGPLLNPARPQCQLVGVSDRSLCPAFSEILQRLGRESAWVACGTAPGGLAVDEISLMGSTRICKSGAFQDLEDEEINPEDFGMRKALVKDLQGGDASENAVILKNILSGKETGPKLDIVILNAAAALACAGLADHMEDAIDIARETITSGAALERLRLMQEASKTA
ncbi:MAG: anthranilate phosphoribosyltransferase [Akkermansiaceae bacterium]|nr:anthranilate phosphoribosyltransferase [Akkermansiaceae bacterium]MDP4721220.1 anthranilate phosphoribosyltransferase [Akkermansiaceae bacterium]MDP4778868.1 anthranilate phosphoribosyltransferase [Akkermansiaceae bacterium]MDP4846931.1 anthranilate phosphoribosyltransferase [Akkermansiaceae bacterium]MDP4897932.1 anthranilate phosphoribosyltransferase [Akkermansiaceae bacterium]